MWQQLVNPNTSITMPAGWCLGLVQRVYRAPGLHNTAWQAWEATQLKHTDQNFPPVSVPVWFDHWGTYGGVYGRYGHVVAWVPGQGFLSSPGSGVGQKWLSSIREIERFYNSTYVGWSEDINTVRTARYVEEPKPNGKKKKMGAFYRSPSGSIVWQEKPNTKVTGIDLTTWKGYSVQGNVFVQLTQAEYDALIKKWGK
jgi:hypothetical protein